MLNTLDLAGDDIENGDPAHVLNLTATISSLLGLSIPYSNMGSIIPNAYIFESQEYCTSFYYNLVLKYYSNLEQVLEYRENYFDDHTYKGKLWVEP